MNISITFRHMASSEAIKDYASEKLGKLQRFLRRPMTAKVTLSIDRLRQIAEARISSGGEHLEAKESSPDMYASIDRMMAKLERQIRGAKGVAQARRRGSDSVRVAAKPAVAAARSGAKKKAATRATATGRKARGPARKR